MLNVSYKATHAHKADTVGTVDFTVDVSNAVLNGQPLNDRAITYLVQYGVKQALTDCYSSASKVAAEKDLVAVEVARDFFNRKLEAIMSGTLSIRESADPFERVMNELTLKAFKDNTKMTFAAFAKSLDDDEKANAVYDKWAESIREQLIPVARARLERESKLGESTPLSVNDILSGLDKGNATLIKKEAKK